MTNKLFYYIRDLNKSALAIGGSNLQLFNSVEMKYNSFKRITKNLTLELAKHGIFLFIILNDSGWGDMPTDTISDLESDTDIDFCSKPLIIGNLRVDDDKIHNNIYCSHFNIEKDIKDIVIKLGNEILGDNFA